MPVSRGHDEAENRGTPRSRRTRRPISCLPCRHRKLRCDRALPACGNCVHRGEITECVYVPRKADRRTEPQEPLDLSETAQQKIDNLERIVRILLENQQNTQGQNKFVSNSLHHEIDQEDVQHSIRQNELQPNLSQDDIQSSINQSGPEAIRNSDSNSPRSTMNISRPSPSIKIGAVHEQSRSLDDAHWALLLNEIGGVRSYLTAQQKRYEQQNKVISRIKRKTSEEPGPTLLFGSSRNMSRSEILVQLPSRYSCDMIIARFFAHLYPAIYILHESTFHKQYEAFWNDTAKTSMVWVALLFAILRVGMLDYIREEDEPLEFKDKCQDLATIYRNSFTDCLIHADYTLPHEFLIESLCFHLYAEYVSNRDAKSNIWVLNGMIIRMAMRMGYHQALQPSLDSAPFQMELRKRVWTFLRQADVMFSFQMGLPSMIGPHLLQDSLPRNIHDDDSFFEGCSKLPTALPHREYTKISFLIAKTKLAFGFARAVEEINRSDSPSRERVLAIDRELRQIYDDVPGHYKLGAFSGQDSFILVSARFVLATIHHKSLCVIHSKFLEVAKSDSRYLYSRRVCLSSAMSILRFQEIQNQEIPVDGRLRSLTNYQTSFTLHDYLLAATIISADLCMDASKGRYLVHQTSNGIPTKTEMIKALDGSARIFSQMRNHSMEAYKAADVLGMLVKRLQTMEKINASTRKTQTNSREKASDQSEGSDSASSPTHPYWQTLQPTFSSTSTQSSCSSLDAGLNLETLDPNYSQALLGDMSDSSQSFNAVGLAMQRPGFLQVPQSDGYSNMPASHETLQSNQFCSYSDSFPESEASASSTSPKDMHHFGHFIMENDIAVSGNTTQLSYPNTLSLSDPMSSLWNLNSWTQGKFP